MVRIDAHQHFWKFDPVRDSWITEEMRAIQKDFTPADLQPLLKQHGFEGCIAVQSDQSEEENAFHLTHAEENAFIKGIVGWVDLQQENVEERLDYYSRFQKMKGFRHVLQGEADRALMLKPEFKRGISKLNKYNYTYDILIFPDQLQYLPEFVSSFPDQPFVIDHLAKPDIKNSKINEWRKEIEAVAAFENVSCKISGMVTEADWKNWKKEDFYPYIDTVFEVFGAKRLLFGSDWPVCLVAASYSEVIEIVSNYTRQLSVNEQEAFWGGNAMNFYRL
ncbi:amidohydrolase family protein [Rubrolithibacter danxiaensis]|uniref:amidohydrolase family protein n=1 Tax=Rubrolithibacter danxiaensis TaxID=3390805 RepID=UPI003BF90E6C